MAASTWFYVQRILIPYQVADAAAHDRPRGNLSDLYPRWLGARELLLHHRDPYSEEVTREIQTGYYGRRLDASRQNDPKDQQAFAYPLYVVFLLAPFVSAPFEALRIGFGWLLAVLTAGGVWLWLKALRWQSRCLVFVCTVLTLGSFPAVQGIKLQQLSLLISSLIAASLALLVSGQLFLAGVLLAVATVKPQLVFLLFAWLALWALSGWRSRQNFLWGFLSTITVLIVGAELLLPGWITEFRIAVSNYSHYTGGRSLLDVLLPAPLGRVFTALTFAMLIPVYRRFGRASAETRNFRLILALVLAVTVVVIPTFAPYNQLLLLPGIFLTVQYTTALWRRGALARLLVSMGTFLILWQWFAAISLTAASVVMSPHAVQQGWQLPLLTTVPIPLAVLSILTILAFEFANRTTKP